MKQPSHLEAELLLHVRAYGLPEPEPEHAFAKEAGRRWRFDLAWPSRRIAAEVEGGIWAKSAGRHNRGSGFEGDCEKYNAATLLGWKVLRFTERMIRSGEAVRLLVHALQRETLPESPLTCSA